MTASLKRKLTQGGVLVGAAGGAYAITAFATQGWSPANYQRNYLALWLVSVAFSHLLIAFRRRIRRAVNSLASQLEQITRTGKIISFDVCADPEVMRVTEKLGRFLNATRSQFDELATEVRELRVQSRVASVEKQDVEGIILSIPEAVVVTNRFDELVLANEPAERLLGFHLQSDLRKTIDRCINDAALLRLIHDARRNGMGGPQQVVEHEIDVDGKSCTFSVTLTCLTTEKKEINGVVTVLRDITRDKEISQMKSDFVSNVSHELKTPLASIMAYTEMLVSGEADDEETRQSFYKTISSETGRLNRLIENILNISRIESGAIQTVSQSFSLSRTVRQVLDVASPQINAKDIEMTEDLAPVYYNIKADEDLIYQAVMNLISNAVKYTPKGGKVDVGVIADEENGTITFRVTDTGVGIPADDIPRIFEKFYRVQANEKLAKGTGLGLALVKYIIESLSGGNVAVTSEVDKGSTFGFELPLLPVSN